jgi:hypothetical protein
MRRTMRGKISAMRKPRKKARRKLNPRLLQARTSYRVEKMALVLGVCPNTIHNKIKEGMPIIEGSYPFLIWGADAQAFIKGRQAKRKHSLKQDELFCMRCGRGTNPKNGIAMLEMLSPKRGHLKAICDSCGITKTNRWIALKDLNKFHEVMHIHTLPHSRLGQGLNSSGICETRENEING